MALSVLIGDLKFADVALLFFFSRTAWRLNQPKPVFQRVEEEDGAEEE